MRPRVLCLALALAVLAGCEKTNDLPRLQAEAAAVIKRYEAEFAELAHRAEAIRARATAVAGDRFNASDGGRAFRQGLGLIEDRRRDLQQVTGRLDEIARSGKPGAPSPIDELHRAIDVMHERFETAATEVTWDLSAAESWIAAAEQRGAPREPHDGAGEGSAAPIR